ncbi:uncharacterized protein MELLADRAFT_102629 [Melampsora larici-populina 98AG31]|uniref:Uncharacterized protein n=1 Tax=Melampsora larici-populina (strain 98AG31 / pathotype 3-4-7) TaxID=747676 RepID=F4R8W0_MELLP|nr:uncharacterized protein MELLADRAFT_102629 [Melampsora larici-populina 98AG31]EGG11261.1 hypothetical protein MELLADRAFT_102629 [Melampsora larici-populina 98AG31]
MSLPKFKPDPRRVVCRCQTSGCYKGIYIDAMGISHQGIEVVPATREAHERADKHSRIQSVSALGGDQDPTRPKDNIISDFDQLTLTSHLVTQHSSQNNTSSSNIVECTDSHGGLNPMTDSRTETLMNNNQQQSVDSQVLAAAQKARERSVNEYDCKNTFDTVQIHRANKTKEYKKLELQIRFSKHAE